MLLGRTLPQIWLQLNHIYFYSSALQETKLHCVRITSSQCFGDLFLEFPQGWLAELQLPASLATNSDFRESGSQNLMG